MKDASAALPGKCSETTALSFTQSQLPRVFYFKHPMKIEVQGTSPSSGEGKGLRVKKVKISLWELFGPITKNHRKEKLMKRSKDRKVNTQA